MPRIIGTSNREVDERVQKAYQLYITGTPTAKVAEILGRDPTTVRRYFKKLRKRIDEHYNRSYAAIGRWASVRRRKEIDTICERMGYTNHLRPKIMPDNGK